MSRFPAIPDVGSSLESVANSVRGLKDSVEILTGKRQGQALGVPDMYVQENEPAPGRQTSFKTGDLWIKPSTRVLSYWSGQQWVALA